MSLIDDYAGKYSCTVECDPKSSHHYFIYSINQQTDEKTLFGQLSYQLTIRENIYEIIIGQKIYNVRSSDLQDRQLTIIDTITNNGYYPNTLLQINDSFPQANAQYHMNIHDREWALGYIAITILLHLHELQRNSH